MKPPPIRTLRRFLVLGCVVLLVPTRSTGFEPIPPDDAPPVYPAKILNKLPHDPDSFTQGFCIHKEFWIEGTGLYGESKIRILKAESDQILREKKLPDTVFGEGVALLDGRIHQLTWKSRKAFVWDLETLEQVHSHPLPVKEGWGLTQDGESLILSDGSNTLYFLSPRDYQIRKKVGVFSKSRPVHGLNELESIHGQILANVWPSAFIAVINPVSGRVTAWLDCRNLAAMHPPNGDTDVLNGIAYDGIRESLFLTGKKWPKVYEIELPPFLKK